MGEQTPTPDPTTDLGATSPPTDWVAPTSAPTPPPDPPPPAAPAKKGGARVELIAGAAVVALAAFIGLGIAYASERNTTADLRDQVADLKEATTTTAAADEAEEDEGIDLKTTADGVPGASTSGVDVSGGSDSVTVDISYPGPDAIRWLENYMARLDMPAEAIASRMGQTRALDGTQEDEANGIRVTWNYHPDDGLSAVFSVE
jgi:hypothetical protein